MTTKLQIMKTMHKIFVISLSLSISITLSVAAYLAVFVLIVFGLEILPDPGPLADVLIIAAMVALMIIAHVTTFKWVYGYLKRFL